MRIVICSTSSLLWNNYPKHSQSWNSILLLYEGTHSKIPATPLVFSVQDKLTVSLHKVSFAQEESEGQD